MASTNSRLSSTPISWANATFVQEETHHELTRVDSAEPDERLLAPPSYASSIYPPLPPYTPREPPPAYTRLATIRRVESEITGLVRISRGGVVNATSTRATPRVLGPRVVSRRAVVNEDLERGRDDRSLGGEGQEPQPQGRRGAGANVIASGIVLVSILLVYLVTRHGRW